MQRIKEWCYPLEITDDTIFIVRLAKSFRSEFEETMELSLHVIFVDILVANDAVTQSIWAEALRFQQWYYWHHISDFESMMIMVSRLGLFFWRMEEDWSIQWIDHETPQYVSAKALAKQLREIFQARVAEASTDAPSKPPDSYAPTA